MISSTGSRSAFGSVLPEKNSLAASAVRRPRSVGICVTELYILPAPMASSSLLLAVAADYDELLRPGTDGDPRRVGSLDRGNRLVVGHAIECVEATAGGEGAQELTGEPFAGGGVPAAVLDRRDFHLRIGRHASLNPTTRRGPRPCCKAPVIKATLPPSRPLSLSAFNAARPTIRPISFWSWPTKVT